MSLVASGTKFLVIGLAAMSVSGCLGFSRPDATFSTVRVTSPRGGAPVEIAGRVEASKISISTLERRVVITANGTEVGRATLPDARLASAAATPVDINGTYQGVAIAARCENHEFVEPPGERRGIVHRLTFAEINCQVRYGSNAPVAMRMMHSPHGTPVAATTVASATPR